MTEESPSSEVFRLYLTYSISDAPKNQREVLKGALLDEYLYPSFSITVGENSVSNQRKLPAALRNDLVKRFGAVVERTPAYRLTGKTNIGGIPVKIYQILDHGKLIDIRIDVEGNSMDDVSNKMDYIMHNIDQQTGRMIAPTVCIFDRHTHLDRSARVTPSESDISEFDLDN